MPLPPPHYRCLLLPEAKQIGTRKTRHHSLSSESGEGATCPACSNAFKVFTEAGTRNPTKCVSNATGSIVVKSVSVNVNEECGIRRVQRV